MDNAPFRHRRSIRLLGYDYTRSAAYFVTIVTHHRECCLGEVVNGNIQLTQAGCIVQEVWHNLPNHYPHVELDAFVIMPNHVHGIIILKFNDGPVEAGLRPAVGPIPAAPAEAGPIPAAPAEAGSISAAPAGAGSISAAPAGAGLSPCYRNHTHATNTQTSWPAGNCAGI
jgi:hypothetical protein